MMPWQVGKGTKQMQQVRVPEWIKDDPIYTAECLRGLLQTDGSMYRDRGYLMVNFTNHSFPLARDVYEMLITLGFRPTLSTASVSPNKKYTVRIARNSDQLIKRISLYKN